MYREWLQCRPVQHDGAVVPVQAIQLRLNQRLSFGDRRVQVRFTLNIYQEKQTARLKENFDTIGFFLTPQGRHIRKGIRILRITSIELVNLRNEGNQLVSTTKSRAGVFFRFH